MKSLIQKYVTIYKFSPEGLLQIRTKYSLIYIYHKSKKKLLLRAKWSKPSDSRSLGLIKS